MTNLIKALQAVDGVQNASHQDLLSMHDRLKESLTAVNATMNEIKVQYEKSVCISVCKRLCAHAVANVFNTIKAFSAYLSMQGQGCFYSWPQV